MPAQAGIFFARIKVLKKVLVSAEAVLSSYQRQFLTKGKSWQEVMNAQRELNTYEERLATAEAALLQYTWQLALYGQGVDHVLLN